MNKNIIKATFELHNSIENKDKPIADFVADKLIECRNIQRKISAEEAKIRLIQEKYNADLKMIKQNIEDIQLYCDHISYTKFPDASGGTDSYLRCDICGKEL